MRIMIDQAIPSAAGLFARLGEVRTFDGRSLRAADLADADALIVRSVTRVDAALLAGSQVRFVGTATSGTDHVDEARLAREGIRFAAAPGCNARPVAEYALTAILWLARQRQFDPRTKTLGVVGVGHTGSLVARWAQALGMEVLLCDPPLQDAGGSTSLLLLPTSTSNECPNDNSERPDGLFLPPLRGGIEGGSSQPTSKAPSSHWLSQLELLARSDIITLHVPLTLEGPHTTREMVNPGWLGAMKPGSALINTARGEVVAESALIEARRSGRLSGLVVDVWTGEPTVNEELAAVCDIATPHVAGYSVEAKRRAVATIYDALAEWAGISTPTEPSSVSPRPASFSRDRQKAATSHARDFSATLDALQTACSLSNIDAGLRAAMAEGTLAERFDTLRSEVSQRREFPDHRLNPVQFTPAAAEFLVKVGFSLSERLTGAEAGR